MKKRSIWSGLARIEWLVLAGLAAVACSAGAEDAASSESAATEQDAVWAADWNAADRKTWYTTPQGSHLLDYDVFMALEDARTGEAFATRKNLERLGFVYPPNAAVGRLTADKRLPLGVVKDRNEEQGRDYVGLTCSACHTGEIKVKGKPRIVIDAGQSFVDLESFFVDLAASLEATRNDPAKRQRFCVALGGERAKCDARLDEAADRMADIRARNEVVAPDGPGRLDAVTRILNEVFAGQLGGAEAEPVSVPISYPQVWDAPRLECVQTNCLSKNSLTRNIGETLGVFGHAKLRRGADGKYAVDGTSKVENLYKLEKSLESLWSPKWDERTFGAIDQAKKARGEALFDRTCASCHAEPYKGARAKDAFVTEEGRPEPLWKVTTMPFGDVGTDPTFIEVHGARMVKDPELTELFDQALKRSIARSLGSEPDSLKVGAAFLVKKGEQLVSGERRLDGSVAALLMLGAVTSGVELGQVAAIARRDGRDLDSVRRELEFERAPVKSLELANYRARPLNGIAFTAPFGHNGAWPTLRDVLEPASRRPETYVVRPGTFDPKRVGLVTSPARPAESNLFVLDTGKRGNSKAGHEYGTDLGDADKDALLEYLKSL